MKRFPILAVVGLILLAFTARVADLGGPSLWYDEGFSVMAARLPLTEMLGLVVQDHNTPLHFLLLKLWAYTAGESEFSARALSAFAGVLAVAAAGRVVVMTGRRQALGLALLLAAVFPVSIALAREARPYGLLALLVTLLSAETMRLCRVPGRRRWIAWALLGFAAFGTHVLGGLAWATATIMLAARVGLGRGRRRPDLWLGVMTATASGAVIFGWAIILLVVPGDQTTFAGPVSPSGLLAMGLGANILPRMEPAILQPPAIAIGAALILFALWRRGARPAALFALGCIVGAVAVGAITGKFAGRYAASAASVLAAAVAIALSETRFAKVSGLFIAAMLGAAAWLGITTPKAANEDYRGVARFLRQSLPSDETILLVSGYFAPVFSYYYGPIGWTALPDDPLAHVWKTYDYESAAPALNRALEGKRGVWLLKWQESVMDPAAVIPDLLRRESIAYVPDRRIDQFSGLRLTHYRFNETWRTLPDALPLVPGQIVRSGKDVGLSGAGCAQLQLARVSELYFEVACVWQLRPFVGLPYDAQVSIRIEDRQGNRILQSDQQLLSNGLPGLRFEKPLLGLYLLQMPAKVPPGDYTLRAIPYYGGTEWAPTLVSTIRFDP